MKFESNMNRLEEIIEKIEETETNIDDGIRLYEEGVHIATECLADLKTAKGKVSVLQAELDKLMESDLKFEDDE